MKIDIKKARLQAGFWNIEQRKFQRNYSTNRGRS